MKQPIHTSSSPMLMPTDRTTFGPPTQLESIRENLGLCRLLYPDGHVGWLVSSYRIARTVLSDRRFSMHPVRLPVPKLGDPTKQADLLKSSASCPVVFADAFRRCEQEGRPHSDAFEDPAVLRTQRESPPGGTHLLFMDPPRHTRLRRILAGHFTVRRIGERRTQIERIVEDCLDSLQLAGPPAEIVETFALPLTSLTICRVLGALPSDRRNFEPAVEAGADPDSNVDELRATGQRFHDFARRLVEQKRREPEDDLLSELVHGSELTDDELVGVTVELFGAGYHTTARMLALITFALLHDRRRWDSLVADLLLVPNAVEECLRFVTLLHVGAFSRTALEDIELDGYPIKSGESVTVSLAAANRDPEKFVNPDKLELGRDTRGHIAFGHGIHQCLGQHLARLEMQVALGALIQRLPTLKLAVPADEVPLYGSDRFAYGVHRLPVTW